jgi:signal transduction histidine kinase
VWLCPLVPAIGAGYDTDQASDSAASPLQRRSTRPTGSTAPKVQIQPVSIKAHPQQVLLRSPSGASEPIVPKAGDLWGIAVIAALVLGAGGISVWPAAAETVGALGMVVGGATAATLFVVRSRPLEWKERRAWLALAFGSAVSVLGVLSMVALTFAGVTLPAFGWFDILFLGGYLSLTLSFGWLAVAEDDGPGWPAVVADVMVGAVGFVVLVWVLVGSSLVGSLAGAPAWQQVVAPLYPIADIAVVLGLMAMTLRRTQFHFDPRLSMLGLGLALQVLADLSYLVQGLGSTFVEAAPRYDVFMLGFACYLATAMIVGRTPRRHEFPDRPTPMWALVWPYLMLVAVAVAHFRQIQALDMTTEQTLTLGAVAATVVLVIARQVYVISRHSGRVDAQRRELVASVSHELRTPLTGMLGFLEVLAEDPEAFDERERTEVMATVTEQARHLSSVVGDLIVLARDGGRNLPVKPGRIELGELCRRAVAVTGMTGIELHVHRDVDIFVDAGRMTQAIVNLINNARLYGAGRCRVIAGRDGSDAWIEVHDDGPGVPIRNQKSIWNQFERGQYRYDATAPGLGLGLAITRAVAVAHGGSATYRRSEILDGACFVVTVPIPATSPT